MARPSSAPEAEATARVYRLFAAYSVKDIVGENFRSHALLVNTATPTPRSGSIVISANVPVKSPPRHTARSPRQLCVGSCPLGTESLQTHRWRDWIRASSTRPRCSWLSRLLTRPVAGVGAGVV